MNKKKILLFILMMAMSFNINAAQTGSFAETINNENIEVIATYDNEMPQEIKKVYNPNIQEKVFHTLIIFLLKQEYQI